MKKFTGNFLFGEHGFGYVLRKIGLSMVAILLTVAVYAQPQETYHVFAEDVEDCYRHDNEYLVSISMRDFVEIDSFFLVLNYDDALFNYEGVSATVSELSGLSITDNSGDLEMVWDSGDDPQTIEDTDNDTSEVFVLHFSRNGYLHNAGNPALNHVNSALEWDEAASSVWSDAAQQSQILTFAYGDGSIDVTQTIPEVVLDKSTANCDGGNALVTVTTPAYEDGMTYSWNQDDDFQSDPSTQVVAPSQGNTVEVRLGDCTSFIHTFSVDANPPLSYDVQEDIYVKCAGGLGDLEFDPEGGSGSYSYYIVPEADTARVINDLTNTGKTNEQAVDYLDSEGYNTGNRVNQLSPGFYLVAVQDGNNCADLREVEWWTGVEVMDTIPEWDHAVTHILDEQCYDANNGEFTLMVSGGTPFDGGGYNIMFDGHEESTVTNTLEKTELAPGAYDVAFYDQHGCSWDTTITIEAAEQIDFAVDHTDASCDLDNGELWIEEATLEGGSGSYDYWVYSMDPNFATADTIWSVSDTATGLAPNVYYVRVFDDLGCFDDYENINGDNAVKVLSIDFDIEVGTIECNGGTTSATIVVENPGNHTFGFNIDGGAFSSENVFEGLTAGTYSFGVYDSTINCVNYWKKEIEERTELTVDIIDLLTTEPSCHDANDGHIQVRADGGTPFDDGTKFYEYKFDDRPWEDGGESNTFAADTGFHMITVRDANGCEATVTTTLDLTPNVIEVPETFALDCYGDVTVLWQEAMYADSSSIVKSWIQEPVGDNQGDREPEIYYCMSISDDAAAIVANGMAYTDTSTFAAGTYYFAAQDEWGCVSNIDTLVVTQPDAIVAEAEVVRPAGCAGVNDGQIMIEAFLGIDRGGSFEGRYQYSFTQSAAIMQQDDWYDEVDWHDFTNDDAANDSVVALDVAKGTYWIAVRDSCGKKNPVLIEGPWELVVDGAEPIEVNWDLVDVMDVTCNVAGEDPSNDGSITGLLGATTGGWGDYIFTLDMEHHDASVLKAGHLDFPRENMTGDFYDLPAGDYVLTIEDDSLGCIYTDDVEITQPNPLWLDTDSLYVSCDGETDGVIRYTISGGTPPYLETTNNVGVYEDVNSIPEDRWYAVDSVEYDRRMPAGVFATYIKDDNGCIYGPVIDTIKQPEPLALELVGTIEPSCATDGVDGDDDDGQIWVVPTGGWHSDMDNYMYEVSLGGTSYTVDLGDTVKFTGLSASEYTISVVERNSSLPANPIITYSDYFTKWGNGDYDSHLPWQNASSDCAADIDVNLQGPDPIVYDDIMWYDEQCYKTPTGEIHLMDISGGTPPYTVWVEGPTAYRPDNAGVGEEILLEDDGVNLDDYIWDDLVRGNYTVYVQDANECQIVEESGEIGRPDSLMITNTELVENAKCKDGLGTIQIDAEGGVAPYWYAVDYSLVPTKEHIRFHLKLMTVLNGKWPIPSRWKPAHG